MSENQSQVSAVEKPEVPKPSLRSTIKEKFPKFRRYKEGKQEPREVLEDLNSERVTGLSAEMAADKTSFSLPDVFLPAQSQYDEFVNTLGSFDVQSEYQKLQQEMQDRRARYKAETPERQFTKTDHLRHKALEAAARAQGIKDIKGFNDLVNDFERRLTRSHHKNEHFDREPTLEEKNKIIKKWEKEGYKIQESDFRRVYDGTDRYEVYGFKDAPLNIQLGDIKVIKAILEMGDNSVQAVKTLQDCGFNLNPSLLGNEELAVLSSFVGLLGNKDNQQFMEDFAKATTRHYRGIRNYLGGDPYTQREVDGLLNLLQTGEAAKYSTDLLDRMSVIAEIMRLPVDASHLSKLAQVADTPSQFDFLITAVSKEFRWGIRDGENTLESINLLSQKKLLEPFTKYLQANLDYNLGYGDELNIEKIESLFRNPAVQQVVETSEMKDFAKALSVITGKRFDAEKVVEFFPKHIDIFSTYNTLSSYNLFPKMATYDGDSRKIDMIVRLLNDDVSGGVLRDPDFPKFLQEMRDAGVILPQVEEWRSNSFSDSVFRIYNAKFVAGFTGENIVDIARDFYSSDPQVSRAADYKISHFSNMRNNLELFKTLDSLGVLSKDMVTHYTYANNIVNNPFFNGDVMAKVPPNVRAQWVKDGLVLPSKIQIQFIRQAQGVLYAGGGYDTEQMEVTADILGNVHKTADLMRSVFGKDDLLIEDTVRLNAIGELLMTNPLVMNKSDELVKFLRDVVENTGDGFLPTLKEFNSYPTRNPDQEVDLSKMSAYLQKYKDPINSKDDALRRGYKMLGDNLTFDSYIFIDSILDGTVSDEVMKQLGLTHKGQEGVTQLDGVLRNFIFSLTRGNTDYGLLDNSVISDFLKAYTRYETAAWGAHGEDSFLRLIQTVKGLKEAGVEVETNLFSSGIQEVAKLEKTERPESLFTESFLSRYGTITNNIKGALYTLSEPRAFSTIGGKVALKKDEVIQKLSEDLEKNKDNPKAQSFIQKRIDKLNSVNPTDVKSFQENFAILAQEKEFNDLLMQAVFAYSLRKFPEQQDRMNGVIAKAVPDADSISAVIDFTEHMTSKEAWSSYFTDKNARRAFQNILDTKELADGLSRLKDASAVSKDKTIVEFTPTRGVLMELSGYIGDACWASRYDSIAKQFPNITGIIMQDVSKEVPKLIGSSMLIETTALDGTPLMIIRGLNPQESYINHVDVADFYKKYTEYVKRLAESRGRKAAIVIDGHSGGAATNRPLLFAHLAGQKKDLDQISVSPVDTTFNGYSISNETYLLS